MAKARVRMQVGALIAVGTGIMRPSVISELLNKGSTQLPGMISHLDRMFA